MLPEEVTFLWNQWIDLQIHVHETWLLMESVHGCQDIESGLSSLKGLVVTRADHFPRTARVTCPSAFD